MTHAAKNKSAIGAQMRYNCASFIAAVRAGITPPKLLISSYLTGYVLCAALRGITHLLYVPMWCTYFC